VFHGDSLTQCGKTDGADNSIYDTTYDASAGGVRHPECSQAATTIAEALPTSHPLR
jgi:hypothetical protein